MTSEGCGAVARTIDVVHRHNDNRVIAFTRGAPARQLLIVASLNDAPFDHGYVFWDGLFAAAGGRLAGDLQQRRRRSTGAADVGNGGGTLQVNGGVINAVIPANGFVVLRKAS